MAIKPTAFPPTLGTSCPTTEPRPGTLAGQGRARLERAHDLEARARAELRASERNTVDGFEALASGHVGRALADFAAAGRELGAARGESVRAGQLTRQGEALLERARDAFEQGKRLENRGRHLLKDARTDRRAARADLGRALEDLARGDDSGADRFLAKARSEAADARRDVARARQDFRIGEHKIDRSGLDSDFDGQR